MAEDELLRATSALWNAICSRVGDGYGLLGGGLLTSRIRTRGRGGRVDLFSDSFQLSYRRREEQRVLGRSTRPAPGEVHEADDAAPSSAGRVRGMAPLADFISDRLSPRSAG
jgi:hypothetical protein